MPEITPKIYGITFQSTFRKPVLFRDADCAEIAQVCLEAFGNYGLKPTQISVRPGDQTFNYDLSFSLFNGNGTFKVSAEKFEINFQGATGEGDIEIISDCTAKFYDRVSREIGPSVLAANAHVSMPHPGDVQSYLKICANPAKQIVKAGILAYIACSGWQEEIRLTVDRSIPFPDGLYLEWATTQGEGKLSRDLLRKLGEAFLEALTKFDLTLRGKN